jgi:hypothetical protein
MTSREIREAFPKMLSGPALLEEVFWEKSEGI